MTEPTFKRRNWKIKKLFPLILKKLKAEAVKEHL